MPEQSGIALIQHLQMTVGSLNLSRHFWIAVRGIRETALGGEHEILHKFSEAGGNGLLVGNAVFEIRERIRGDGVHASLELRCETMQLLQVLRGSEYEILVAGSTHIHHNS